jgi:hypothetical protein
VSCTNAASPWYGPTDFGASQTEDEFLYLVEKILAVKAELIQREKMLGIRRESGIPGFPPVRRLSGSAKTQTGTLPVTMLGGMGTQSKPAKR